MLKETCWKDFKLANKMRFNENVIIRYADALYNLANVQNSIDETYFALKEVVTFIKADFNLQEFLTSPLRMPSEHLIAVNALLRSLKINGLVANFLKLLCIKRRLPALMQISEKFHELYNKFKGIGLANITVANTVSSDFIDDVAKTIFNDRSRDKINIIINIDSYILGGFIVYFDNKRIDLSIRNKLNMLTNAMKEAI